MLLCALPALFCSMYPGNLRGRVEGHALDVFLRQVHARVGADIGEGIPFIHAKFADADVDVETIVTLWVDLALRQMVLHLFVCLLAAFNLRNKPASSFGKIAYGTRYEAFPPLMVLVVCPVGPFPCTDTDEDTNLTTWPLVADSLVEHHGSRVIFAAALVKEDRLPDLDRLESERSRSSCASGLPDGGIGCHGGFFARVVGSEPDLAGASILAALVNCGDSSAYC